MTHRCSECGALFDDPQGCWQAFGALLEREFVDAAYGRVHHLTVTTYMLQHPTRLSRRGWLEMRELLRLHLRDGISVAGWRSRVRSGGVNSAKGWKIKPDGTCLNAAVGWPWPITVASIALEDPEVYGEQIQAWAASTLHEAEQIPAD